MYTDNLSEIKKYCKDIVCFYTKNDPYVKFEAEKEFASISTKEIIIPEGGHLNGESGYIEFKELLEEL